MYECMYTFMHVYMYITTQRHQMLFLFMELPFLAFFEFSVRLFAAFLSIFNDFHSIIALADILKTRSMQSITIATMRNEL